MHQKDKKCIKRFGHKTSTEESTLETRSRWENYIKVDL